MATQGHLEWAARREEMLRLRGEGLSLAAIGRRFPHSDGRPITRQAVYQTLRNRSIGRVNQHTARSSWRRAEAMRLLREGREFAEIAQTLGVRLETVYGYYNYCHRRS